MAKIKWSSQSLEDIKEICKYIAIDSPYYAQITRDRIFELVEHLELLPEIGRSVLESNDKNVREIFYKNYRIIYQNNKEFIEILTVIHASRILKL